MWAGFSAIRAVKMDASGELLPTQNKYVGPVSINDEDMEEQAADSGADAAPTIPNGLVMKSKPRQLPTAHDVAGKFTTPDKDTGVGHKGKNRYNHLGTRLDPANNAPPDVGTF
jgi:hypothetical protein